MAAKLALVTPRKQKLATTRPAQSTACGSNGDTGQSARNHAVAESRTERENVTVPSSEEKNARVSLLCLSVCACACACACACVSV